MYGRNGVDGLCIALTVVGCVIHLATSFAVSMPYLRLISLIPFGLAIFRVLSKNIPARRKENDAFIKFWIPVKNKFIQKKRQFDDKDHKYYKCPGCSHVLRVPRGRGKIEISCPYCQRKFKRNTGKQKVNVVQ